MSIQVHLAQRLDTRQLNVTVTGVSGTERDRILRRIRDACQHSWRPTIWAHVTEQNYVLAHFNGQFAVALHAPSFEELMRTELPGSELVFSYGQIRMVRGLSGEGGYETDPHDNRTRLEAAAEPPGSSQPSRSITLWVWQTPDEPELLTVRLSDPQDGGAHDWSTDVTFEGDEVPTARLTWAPNLILLHTVLPGVRS